MKVIKEKERQNLKTLLSKRPSAEERQKEILLGLVELYIAMGKPIGSQTLQKNGFESLSSATIRNYFAKLEAKGLLQQQHASGGRVPTSQAFSLYADEKKRVPPSSLDLFSLEDVETKEVKALLHHVSESVSNELKLTCFTSLPVFEHDFIQKIKCHVIDDKKLLCILITDYGQVRTEILYTNKPASEKLLRKVETYFLWRLGKEEKPKFSFEKDFQFAKKIYTEVLLRHALVYGNNLKNNFYKTGLCHLMEYPELNNASDLSTSLILFENEEILSKILKKTMERKELSFWIGEDLKSYIGKEANFSIVAMPYFINQTPAGAIALIGPTRLDYQKVFAGLKGASQKLSELLTKNVYKHKIPFHTLIEEEKIDLHSSILLEDKSE